MEVEVEVVVAELEVVLAGVLLVLEVVEQPTRAITNVRMSKIKTGRKTFFRELKRITEGKRRIQAS